MSGDDKSLYTWLTVCVDELRMTHKSPGRPAQLSRLLSHTISQELPEFPSASLLETLLET